MSKFGHYSVEVTKDTAIPYEMYGIEGTDKGPVTLMVRPAWDINTDYAGARLKTSQRRARAMGKKKNVDVQDVRALRQQDYAPYASHIVTGWENIVDQKKKPVEFSEEDCLEFLKAIPEPEFDELRNFCNDHTNWGLDPIDEDEVGGN